MSGSTAAPGGLLAPLRTSPVFRVMWSAQAGIQVAVWVQTVTAQWILVDRGEGVAVVALVQSAISLRRAKIRHSDSFTLLRAMRFKRARVTSGRKSGMVAWSRRSLRVRRQRAGCLVCRQNPYKGPSLSHGDRQLDYRP